MFPPRQAFQDGEGFCFPHKFPNHQIFWGFDEGDPAGASTELLDQTEFREVMDITEWLLDMD